MSNEIKNRQHAIGLFAPVPVAPFTTPIVSEVGIDTFVRNSAGNYTLGLRDAAPFAQHAVGAGMGANVLGTIGGQLAPDGKSVLVTAFSALGVPFDPPHFDLTVQTIRDGEGAGPAPALPGVPTPPVFGSGTTVLGWAEIDNAGALVQQSASNVVASVAPLVANNSQINLVGGTQCGAALVSTVAGNTPVNVLGLDVVTPTLVSVWSANIATGSPQWGACWVTFLGL